MKALLLAAAAGLLVTTTAFAGPVAEFDGAFRKMYGQYRAALFLTNSGKQEPSAKALGGFDASFEAMIATWAETPPPHFADDSGWADTLTQVSALIDQANEEVAAGNLAEAHETLEGVRDQFAGLHLRNGIVTFSDRMNAYHAQMEYVLTADMSAATPGEMLEQAAVMAYLARDVSANPPADGIGNAEFDQLVATFSASVESFLAAARTGDMAQIKSAAGGLKKPYAKLFLKFG